MNAKIESLSDQLFAGMELTDEEVLRVAGGMKVQTKCGTGTYSNGEDDGCDDDNND